MNAQGSGEIKPGGSEQALLGMHKFSRFSLTDILAEKANHHFVNHREQFGSSNIMCVIRSTNIIISKNAIF